MATSAVSLCARALIRLGADPITSFEDATIEAEIARNLYDMTRDALLSSFNWRFATATTTLPRLELSPVADFDFAFQLPADFLRALSAGRDERSRGLSYRISQRQLFASNEVVVLTYLFRPSEQNFPPYFDHLLVSRLAAEFCLPVTENASRAELLFKLAEEEFRRARLLDAQQDTPQHFEDFSLIEVRA